jgi:pyruvate/2-oxoglutarate dehydrogenase complex dihydrolipoamide acyltransferase (E2) component
MHIYINPCSSPCCPLLQGKHTLNVKVTMMKGSAEVNSVASLQPSTDQLFTTKINFNLVDKLPAGAAAAAAPAAAKPAAPAAAAAEEEPAAAAPAAAAPAPKPGTGGNDVTDALADNPKPEPAIDETVTQQAVKYYCMRQYNVGGKIHRQMEVPVGDEGVMACSVACNALGSNCGGFGLTGKKCFLMKAFNTNSSAADATIDALCMKSPNDWLDFGVRNGEQGRGWQWQQQQQRQRVPRAGVTLCACLKLYLT